MTNNEQGKFGIYISNLHSSIDDQTLSDTLSQFGEILSCKVSEKGSGNVFFGSDEAAKSAVEKVNGMMLQGQQVTVVRTDGEFTEVFIKNIKLDITDEELKTFIKKNIEIDGGVDPIKGVNIFRDKENIWATVSFINHETAVNVVSKLNGKNDPEIQKDETPLYIARYIQRQPKAKPKTFSPTSLYVKNLDDSITDQLLKDAFSRFGEVTSAKVMMDDKTPPLPKGFGFVDFKEVDSAYKALAEMNGYLLGSKPLYVNIAQPKEVRRAALEAQYASRSGPRGVPAQIPGYLPGYPPPFFGGPAPGYFNVPGRAMLPPKGWPTGPGGFPGAQFQGPPGGARGRGRGYY